MYDLLIQHLNRGGVGYFWSKDPAGPKKTIWFDPATIPDFPEDGDLYFGVHPAKARRGTTQRARLEDIAAVNCLFAEFDAKGVEKGQLLQHIRELPMTPSVLVDSGGGYHAYWLLAETFAFKDVLDLELMQRIQREWVAFTGGDPAAADLARVLRVPGTYNYKYDPPREVLFIHADFDCLYWLEDFRALLPKRAVPAAGGNGTQPGAVKLPPNLDQWLSKAIERSAGQRNETGFWLACQLRDDGIGQADAESVLRQYQAAVERRGKEAYTWKEAQDSLKSAFNKPPRDPAKDTSKPVPMNGNGHRPSPPNTAMPDLQAPEEPPMEGSPTPPTARNAENGDVGQSITDPAGTRLPDIVYLAMDKIRAGLDLQEVGDADLLVQLYQGQIAFDHAEKKWYLWRGHFWEQDRTDFVYQLLARRVAPQYIHAAAEWTQGARDELAKDAMKRAAALRNKKRMDNVLYLAGRDPGLALTGEEWDKDPWQLGCLNGVLDLRSGKFRPGQPGDFVRAHIESDWCGMDQPAPRWEQFLLEVFNGDRELAFFMQRLLGYGMTGLSTEHVFPILWGEGRNGKGTMLQTLFDILGSRIATPVPAEELMANPRGSQGAQPFLYGLRGKRLVWASESERGHRIDESLVKRLTGGDTITVRTLYSEPVQFDPSHLILMLTNYRPHINANGQAIWDRVLLVPFTQRFVVNPQAANEHKQDPFLSEKLAEERAGILAWLVRGCLEWQEIRLSPPECVTLATKEYRDEEDITGMFLGEKCEVEKSLGIKASVLYATYQQWCKDSGFTAMSLSTFGAEMSKRFEKKRTMKGWYYYGLDIMETQTAY